MSTAELWELGPDEFNKWRRENDLQKLFDVFLRQLPHFQEWLDANSFTIAFILGTDKPGSFFYHESETMLFRHADHGRETYQFVPIIDRAHDRRIQQQLAKTTSEHYRFTPYFIWIKEKIKTDKIIKTKFHEGLDSFRFILRTAPDVPSASSATIAPGFTVLKLGGTKIDGWGSTTFRNLDFTDLDFLEVEGDFHMNRELEIFYSSCRQLKFVEANMSFTKFYGCHFEKLSSKKSRFYWAEFYGCDLFAADFESSSLVNFIMEDCSITNFSFNRVEVDNLVYEPPKKEWHRSVQGTHQSVTENYKRLRVLFQNNGHRREASEAYYQERRFEMRYHWGSINFKQLFPMLKQQGVSYTLPAAAEQFKKVGATVSGYFSYIIWGYGERPSRTVLFSVAIILLYAAIYFFSDIDQVGGDWINSLYVSTIMFTTLGFGDFAPFQIGSYKLLLSTEAMFGAFTFGLFIAGYANKAKY